MKNTFTKLFATVALGVGLCVSVTPSSATAQGYEGIMGEMMYWGGNFPPVNFEFCNGQLLPISQNTALFSILGTTYGGDGRTTFALPDMRGRAVMHPGHGPGLSVYRLGEKGGTEQVTLVESELPSHNHIGRVHASNESANGVSVSDAALATAASEIYREEAGSLSSALHSDTVDVALSAGGNLPHENRQPYIALSCIIRTVGIFPSRS